MNGTLKVPEGPGLGVEIDEEKLAKYQELYIKGDYKPHGTGLGRGNPYLWF